MEGYQEKVAGLSPSRQSDRLSIRKDRICSIKANRRARSACTVCHYRKVRCDAALHGIPCTNCRHTNQECLLWGKAQRRYAKTPEDDKGPGGPSHNENSPVDRGRDTRECIPIYGTASIKLTVDTTFNEALDEIDVQKKLISSISVGGENSGRSNASASTSSSTGSFVCESEAGIPLPDDELQWKLLQYYLDWVHPQLPFLDIQQVAEKLMTEDFAKSNITFILLLQAIFYAGSLYASDDDFRSSCYESKLHAQKTLAHLAKTSFFTNRDDDPLLLSQAALLLSLRATSSRQSLETARCWLNLSINGVQRLTFIHYMQSAGRASTQPRNQRRADFDSALIKLVWSIRMQELTMILGSGEQACIRTNMEGFISPTYLSMDPDKVSQILWDRMSGSVLFKDPKLQELLAGLFYAKLRVSAFVDRVLQSTSSGKEDHGTTSTGSEDLSSRLVRVLSSLSTDCLLSYESSLTQWWHSLPGWMRYAGPPGHRSSQLTKSWRLVSFHRALLGISYQTFSLSICQALVMQEGPTQSSLFGRAIQQQNIELRVKEILNILDWVPDDNLLRFLMAAGPRVAQVCTPALLRTVHGLPEFERTVKTFKLIDKCINYLLSGTSDLVSSTADGPLSRSGYGGEDYLAPASLTDYAALSSSRPHMWGQNQTSEQTTHLLQQCDTFQLGAECGGQHNPARYSVCGRAKLDRNEPASAEKKAGDPVSTLGQMDNGENDTSDSPLSGGFMIIGSAEDNWPSSPSESEEARTTAPSPGGNDYLIPLSPFDSAWLEFDSEKGPVG